MNTLPPLMPLHAEGSLIASMLERYDKLMRTEPYWIDGPWPGRLAIAPRPRGDDWLVDEVRAWHRAGIDTVVSLLTTAEERELGLVAEGEACRAAEIEFRSFPIVDRSVPTSVNEFSDLIAELGERLAGGGNILVHCRQGVGRAGLLAIALLVAAGQELESAIARVGRARGCVVPDTPVQRRWLETYENSQLARLSK